MSVIVTYFFSECIIHYMIWKKNPVHVEAHPRVMYNEKYARPLVWNIQQGPKYGQQRDAEKIWGFRPLLPDGFPNTPPLCLMAKLLLVLTREQKWLGQVVWRGWGGCSAPPKLLRAESACSLIGADALQRQLRLLCATCPAQGQRASCRWLGWALPDAVG